MGIRILRASLGLALLAGACSSSRATITDDAGADDSVPDDEALWLGLIAPAGGPAAAFGIASKNGAELAAREINAAGGVLGRPLRIKAVDEGSVTEHVARALVDDERVLAIVGPLKSSGAVKAIPEIKGKLVAVATAATSPALTNADDGDCFFRVVPSDAYQGRVAASFAFKELGVKTAAMIHQDGPGGAGFAAAFRDGYKQLGGQILADVKYPEQDDYAQLDFAPLVQQAFAGSPAAVLVLGDDEDSARIVAAAQQDAGYKAIASTVKLLGWHMQGPVFARSAIPAVVDGKFYGTLPVAPRAQPSYQRYAAAYAAAYAQPAGEAPHPLSEASYDAVYALAYALQRHGSATADDRLKILASLRAVSGPPGAAVGAGEWAKGLSALGAGEEIDYAGPSGPGDFDMHGDPSAASFAIYRVAGGKLEIVVDDYQGWM